MGRTARLSVSASFVGANFAASFLVLVLIARHAAPVAREVFFTFQAIFFLTVMLSSQTAILQAYRGARDRLGERVVEAGIFIATLLLLAALAGGKAAIWELLAYAAATVASARAATAMAAVQFAARHWAAGLVPPVSAACRLAAAWALIEAGPAASFLGAAAVQLAVAALARAWIAGRGAGGEGAAPAARGDYWQMLAFTAATAAAFQWDRLLLSAGGFGGLVVASGVVVTWVLPPLSLLFATVYRASAAEIFVSARPADARMRIFRRQGGLFAAAGAAYLAALLAFWELLNGLVFPFHSGGAGPAALLGAAVMLDRIGNLAAFLAGLRFARLAALKFAAILAALGWVALSSPPAALAPVYAAYLAQAAAWAVVALAALFRDAGRAPAARD